MTYYELIKDAEHKLNFNKITLGEYEEMIKPLKREIEQQPSEDCISRKETIEWLKKVTVTEGIEFKTGFEQIIYDIEQMPSVTPKCNLEPYGGN